jgi:multiple sugar transport system permease protein
MCLPWWLPGKAWGDHAGSPLQKHTYIIFVIINRCFRESVKIMKSKWKDSILFLSPLVTFAILLMLVPVLGTFWTSLWRDVAFLPSQFLGLGNYSRLLSDGEFYTSLTFTLLFTIGSVAIEMLLGIGIALVINEKFPGRGLLRGIALLPWAIPCVIGARIWQLIYRYDYGLANYIITLFSGASINWLGSEAGAYWSLVVADVWRTTPFVAIIILAGLQSVPKDLYEQACIDGAGMVGRFIHVTLPSITPVLVVALLFRTVDALRVFDIIYVITGGGPGGFTTSVSMHGYKYFLTGDFGYGSTISISLFLIAFIIAVIFLKAARFRERVM